MTYNFSKSQQAAYDAAQMGKNIFITGSGGCVDAATEYLTKSGWKTFDSYNGEDILVFNTRTNTAYWSKPFNYIKLPCERLNRFHSQYLDMVLCDDHRFIYYHNSTDIARELKFSEIVRKHRSSTNGFQGKVKVAFNYTGAEGIDMTEGELRLQIAVMADGRVVKGGKANYTQMRFAKPHKYERLKELCEKFNLPYKDNGYKPNRNYTNGIEYEVIVWPKFPHKNFTEYYYGCNSIQIETILDEVRYWDAHIEKGGHIRYFSNCKSDADFIQFCAASCGKPTHVRLDSRKNKECYVVGIGNGSPFKSLANKDCKKNIDDFETKDGYKYCFTVETGAFVARRSDKIFITGNCGKSYLTKALTTPTTLVVAPTGIAALNVNGVTCHRAFGLPIGLPKAVDLNTVNRKAVQVLRAATRIIISEIGMVRVDQLELIDKKLKLARGNNKPFGGVQVIVEGDFFQLEPIVSEQEEDIFYSKYKHPFSFGAKAWKFETYQLNEPQRHPNIEHYNILNEIRYGQPEGLNKLLKLVPEYELSENILHLCCRNADSKKVNDYWYERNTNKEHTYKAFITGKMSEKDVIVPEILNLKVGCKVLLCANDINGMYVNGDSGKILDLKNNEITVELDNGNIVLVNRFTWESYSYSVKGKSIQKDVVGSFNQFPITLGWAVSIHKSQGMTLDAASIHTGSGCFAHGQFYVAVSRVRDLNNLTFIRKNKITQEDLIVRQEVLDFYGR